MLRSYFIIAFKVLLRRKLFTAVSLFGIGFTLLVLVVSAAIFEQKYSAQPPEVHADRCLGIFRIEAEGPDISIISRPGYYLLDRYIRTLPDVECTSIYSSAKQTVSYYQGKKIESTIRRCDGAYWRILQFELLEGRPFSPDEESSASFVAVINQTTRERYFGDQPAVGKMIEADGQRFRVVGVVKDVCNLREVPFADIWVPLSTAKSDTYRRQVYGGFGALILARDRADFPRIKAEVHSRFAAAELPEGEILERVWTRAETYTEREAAFLLNDHRANPSASKVPRLYAVAVAVMLLFMLLPAVNLVNLNLSRIIERSSEIGVRKAFGASSRALVGQLLIENIVLTLTGGLLALLASAGVLELINRSGLIPYAQLSVNPTVMVCGLMMALVFGLVSGVYPAWRMSRLHPAQALSGRSS